MKKAQSFIIFLASLSFLHLYSVGQEPIRLVFSNTPIAYDADLAGDFYLGFSNGQLVKFSKEGDRLQNYSLPNNSSATLVDAQNRLRPFIFAFDNQQIIVLDRFSSVPKTYPMSEFAIPLALLACPAPDNDFWILEVNPTRLKKYNPLRKTAILEVQPQLGDSITQMKSFQNLLFITDEAGIHIFDVFGAQVAQLAISDLQNIQVYQSKVYLFTKTRVLSLNPFDVDDVTELTLPGPNPILKLPNYWVLLSGDAIELLPIKQ